MRITCPQCQFKGLIDSAPLAVETQVACVRCGTTFEAVLVEGEIQTNLLPDNYESFLAPEVVPEADVEVAPAASDAVSASSDAEDVLALPQSPEVSEPALALDDVLLVSVADVEPAVQENLPANQGENAAAELAVVTETCSAQSLNEWQAAEIEADAGEPSFNFGHARAEAAADSDGHAMGMRLMRISPLWLLICGVTFISVIILSNQFAKPAEPEQRVAANFTSPSNKATNQTLAQPDAPASMNPAATSVQDSSQTAAAAPVELKEETKAVAEKAAPKAVEEPKPVAAPSVAPEAEAKNAAPVAVPQAQHMKAGGFTIQIGSYNVIEQANERVARLQAAGFDARVVAVELPKRGTWYRVQAGRFSSRDDAARYGADLKSKGAADNFIIADAQDGK
jgi:cell division protein FtsN